MRLLVKRIFKCKNVVGDLFFYLFVKSEEQEEVKKFIKFIEDKFFSFMFFKNEKVKKFEILVNEIDKVIRVYFDVYQISS